MILIDTNVISELVQRQIAPSESGMGEDEAREWLMALARDGRHWRMFTRVG